MRGAGVVRALGALLAAGLLVAVVLLAGLDGGGGGPRGSVRNAEDDGWLALFLTLDELGLEPEAWSGSLADLPVGRHALWWGRSPVVEFVWDDPDEFDEEPEPEEPVVSDEDRELDAHDRWLADSPDAPRHLRRFLAQGGRLVVPPTQGTLDWLANDAGLVELEGASLAGRSRRAGPARGPGGESFELEVGFVRELVDLEPEVAREVLLTDVDGESLAVEVSVGRGSVVVLPSDDVFDNAVLRDGDAALFAVRLAETLAPGGRLLFDEALGGRGAPPGLGDLLAGRTLRLATANALLLALLAMVLALAPREFAREPRRSERVSALERARARAGLALRAGQASVLAAPLRAGTLRRAARRLRLRPGDGDLEAELAALRAAAGPRLDLERWTRACTREVADDPAALAELDAELRALESELAAPHDARPHAPLATDGTRP